MIDKRKVFDDGVALPSAIETPKPAIETAWEPPQEGKKLGLLEQYQARKYAEAYQNGTLRTQRITLDQYKAKKLQEARNEFLTMDPIGHFNADSIAALGIGNVDYNTLLQMAYDGKVEITDPGDRKRLTVSWANGWNADRYRGGSNNSLTVGIDTKNNMVSPSGNDVRQVYDDFSNRRDAKGQKVQEWNGRSYMGVNFADGQAAEDGPNQNEFLYRKGYVDTLLAAKMGDQEKFETLRPYAERDIDVRNYGAYGAYAADPEFEKYAAEGAGGEKLIHEDLRVHMTDAEREMYSYLLAKYGLNKASEYVNSLRPRLDQQRGQAKAEEVKSLRGGAWGDIDYWFRSRELAFRSGLDQFESGVKQLGSEKAVKPSYTQYANYYFSKDLEGWDKYAYGIVNQIGNMTPLLLTTTVASLAGIPAPVVKILGATMVGAPAAGNAYTEAIEKGYDKNKAKIYAALVGGSEAGLQYLLGGMSAAGGIAADDLLTKVAALDNALFRFAGTVAITGGAEALEENIQNFLEPLFRTMVFGEKYDLPTWEEIIYTSIVSFVSANLLEGRKVMNVTIHGDGTNGIGQNNGGKLNLRQRAAQTIQNAIAKVTGKKTMQTAQNAADGVSAAGNTQTQVESEKPAVSAETGTERATAQDDEAKKKWQDAFFDGLFGRNKKTVSEPDTVKAPKNMDSAEMRQKIEAAYAAGEMTEDMRAAALDALEKETVQKAQIDSRPETVTADAAEQAKIQEVKNPGFYANEMFTGTGSERQYLDNLARAVGVSIEMTSDDNGNNGWIINDKVYISENAEDPIVVVAKHEITHRIQQAAGDAYTNYRNFVEQILRQRGGLDAKIRAIQELYASRGQQLSREQALDELAADFAGELLENEALIRRIANEDRNLAQRILDGIRDLVRRIKSAFGDAETKKLDRAARLWEAALQEATHVYKRGKVETSSEKRYSVKRTKDNRPYVDVDVDQHLFEGLTTAEMQDAAKKIIKDRFKGQVIGAEYTAFVNKTSAEHFAYPASRRMDESIKQDKMRTAPELDNLIRASRYRKNVIPEEGRHPEATGGLDKLDVMYRVGPRAYEAEITVLVTDRGRVFYDMTKIKDITNREIGQIPGLGNAETEDDIYDDTVSQERKSVKGSREMQRRIDALERQNKRLKEQLKRTDIPKVRREVVKRSAKDLRSMYSSQIDADSLTNRIEDLYNKIAKYSGAGTLQDVKGVPSWGEIKAEASSIAYAILADSRANTNTMAEEYSALKKELHGRKISISEEYRSDLDIAGGYEGIRKQNFGTFTLSKDGTPIESVYMELNEKYPELFPDDIFHPADQLIRLSDVVEDLKPIMGNPFEQDLDNTAEYLAGEIIERFYDTPNEKPTAADKMADAYHRQRIRDQKELRARLENQRRDYEKQAEDLRQKYEKENLDRIERQNAAQRRETIFRHASRLAKKLLRPTNKQHIPEELRGLAFELVKYINLESGFEYDFSRDAMYRRVEPGSTLGAEKTNRTLAALALKKQLEEVASNEALSIDPDMNDYLQEIAEMGSKTLADMSKEELDTVWKVLQIVEHTISRANELHEQGRYKSVADMAEAVEKSAAESSPRKSFVGPVGSVDKLVNFNMLTPETFLHKLGDAGDELFRMMRKSEDRQIEIIKNSVEAAQKMVQESGVDFSKLDKELHTFKLGNGELTLSTSQIMELYALMNRKQAVDHILKGGLKSIGAVKGFVELRNPQPVHVNSGDIAEIVGMLTDKQKKLMDGLQKYLSTILADYGNAETMKVYGYKKFKEKFYWPIKVAGTENKSDPTSKIRDMMIPSYGMTKLTQPKAKKPVELRSAMDSFAEHLNQMSTYAAWLGTNEDINRLINFKYMDEDLETRDTVKRLLETVYGKNGEEYLDKLLGDIAQGTKTGRDKAITEALTGSWKAAKVGANIRVIAQQPTSVLRAMDELNPKYFLSGGNPKKGWEKARKYAPIAQWKDWGYFEINTGRNLRELIVGTERGVDKVRNFFMWGAGAADSMTWGYLWNAVENETADLHPELKKGSDAFYEATAERFGQIIDRTQVVDSVLHRTQIMRSDKDYHKMATNFMGEPSKIYNMVARRIVDLTNAKSDAELKRALKATARTVGSLAASFALNSIVQSLIDALRDDDRDKEYWEKFAENIFGITGEEESFGEAWKNFWSGNFWQNFNPFGYVPYVKDVMSLIQGYDVGRTDMASVTEIINAMAKLSKSIGGEGKKTVLATGFDAFATLCDLFGIPISNLKRDAMAIVNTILNEGELFELQYELDKLMYSEENASSVFFGDIYRAMNADVDAYMDIYEDFYNGMIERGMSEEEAVDEVTDAIEKKMKDEIGVKSVKSLPVRWEPPNENDTDDEKAQKFLQLLFAGEKSGGWASQFPDEVIDAAHEIDAITGDEKQLRRQMVVANGDWDEWIKELQLQSLMSEKGYSRYMAARDARVSTEVFIKMLARAAEIAKERGVKSASQKDIEAALNESRLTKDQKRAIWNSYIETGVWKTESPW